MIMHNHLTAQALQHLNHHKVLIESTTTSIRSHINQLRFDHLYLMPYLLQELEEIQEFPHPHLPDVLQVLCSSQVDVMTVKLPIYQFAIVDILPHHSSTMHRRRHVHDKKYLWFHKPYLKQILETLFQHHNLTLSKQQATAKKRQIYIIAKTKGTGKFEDTQDIPIPYNSAPSQE